MWLRSSNLWSSSNSWINIDSCFVTQLEQHFRVSFDSLTYHSWTWITNIRKSHSIVGEWTWTRILTSCLDPIPELILTPEPLLDLNQIPESVVVHVLPESKSIILSFHTPFWDKGVNKIDSEIICKMWKLDGVKFLIKIIHIYIILAGCIIDVSSGFLRTLHN